MVKNFRKRRALADDDEDKGNEKDANISASLEEIKLIQKQRERTKGVAADLLAVAPPDPLDKDKEKEKEKDAAGEAGEGGEELVLQDTFAQETAITVEDPNMLKYVETELAKRRGIVMESSEEQKEKMQQVEDALYSIPEHLQVKKSEGDETGTAWTTGIAEVQLPIEYKLKNIEETELAKRMLQERRPFFNRPRQPTSTLPASYSADFYQRGREYAEKMRQEHPDQYRAPSRVAAPGAGGMGGGMGFAAGESQQQHGEQRRQTATDDIMLDRFRKRERNRMMRR